MMLQAADYVAGRCGGRVETAGGSAIGDDGAPLAGVLAERVERMTDAGIPPGCPMADIF